MELKQINNGREKKKRSGIRIGDFLQKKLCLSGKVQKPILIDSRFCLMVTFSHISSGDNLGDRG